MKTLNDIFNKNISMNNINELNPLALAFIGDGVHTLYVRDKIIKANNLKQNDYHKLCARECNAKAQSLFLDSIVKELSDDELNIVRRTRNTKIHHTSKNNSEEVYKKATCFEALIGYLYLIGNYDRMYYILNLGE